MGFLQRVKDVCPVRAGGEIRTHDLYFTKVLLYQLSYSGSNGTSDTVTPYLPAGRYRLSYVGLFKFNTMLIYFPVI